jgi:ribosomal protein L2
VPWLEEGLIVKVVHEELADGKYHKKKGVVTRLEDPFTGVIKLTKTGTVLKLHSAFLETVIPNIGKAVRVVGGQYAGASGMMQSLVADQFSVTVRLTAGRGRGQLVILPFEHVCKVA